MANDSIHGRGHRDGPMLGISFLHCCTPPFFVPQGGNREYGLGLADLGRLLSSLCNESHFLQGRQKYVGRGTEVQGDGEGLSPPQNKVLGADGVGVVLLVVFCCVEVAALDTQSLSHGCRLLESTAQETPTSLCCFSLGSLSKSTSTPAKMVDFWFKVSKKQISLTPLVTLTGFLTPTPSLLLSPRPAAGSDPFLFHDVA